MERKILYILLFERKRLMTILILVSFLKGLRSMKHFPQITKIRSNKTMKIPQLKEVPQMVIFTVSLTIFLAIVVLLEFRAEQRVNRSRMECQKHVLETWGDGRNPGEDHECEFGEEWCNPVFAAKLQQKTNNK